LKRLAGDRPAWLNHPAHAAHSKDPTLKMLFGVALSVSVAAAWAQGTPEELLSGSTPLAGEELKARLSGKSFAWQAPGSRFTAKVQYNANGFAFINVSSGLNDSGPWAVEGAQLCSQWKQLPAACAPEVRAKGDMLLVKRTDGSWATMVPN
jgi:hypothetical protein